MRLQQLVQSGVVCLLIIALVGQAVFLLRAGGASRQEQEHNGLARVGAWDTGATTATGTRAGRKASTGGVAAGATAKPSALPRLHRECTGWWCVKPVQGAGMVSSHNGPEETADGGGKASGKVKKTAPGGAEKPPQAGPSAAAVAPPSAGGADAGNNPQPPPPAGGGKATAVGGAGGAEASKAPPLAVADDGEEEEDEDVTVPSRPTLSVEELARNDDEEAAAAAPVDPSPSPRPAAPQHCDEHASSTLTHTGVDYFCCNRAVTPAEKAAVEAGSMTDYIATGGRFPVLVVTNDRAAMLEKTLKSMLSVRCVQPTDVFVVQDGTNPEVQRVLDTMKVPYHQKHSFQGGINPATGRMLDGAERIAQHFRYAINHIFTDAFPKAPAVIIAEDDFLFASDWYEYFHAVAPALESDPTLWLASAWNDNGFDYLVADPYALKRTRFFPGLGWLLPRRVWERELAASWPDTHWDHWMRDPIRHRGRDIVIPEINRNYHAGVKGTFMDMNTHNRYFGSIALQSDRAFTWDTPEGADAIQRILQPAFDRRLESILRDPDTKHLTTVADVLKFNAGTGVVWYTAAPNIPNHDPMRPLGNFFGIWHEGGRGSREGVHEIWWYGSARIILVNACGAGVNGGAVYITGSIACSNLRGLMPPGVMPFDPHVFAGVERPQLPLHTSLFGMVIDSPLAHLDAGQDGNGPPDVIAHAHDKSLAAAAKSETKDAVAVHTSLRRVATGAESHDGHAHSHKRFMGDMPDLPRAVDSHTSATGDVVSGVALPPHIAIVASQQAGISCTDVCATQVKGGGSRCVQSYLPVINDCPTLRANFPCNRCADSVGSDQPAMISAKAPGDKLPGVCLVNGDQSLFSCDGKWEHAVRLCACEKPAA